MKGNEGRNTMMMRRKREALKKRKTWNLINEKVGWEKDGVGCQNKGLHLIKT